MTCSPYGDPPDDMDRFHLKEFVDFVAAGDPDPRAQGAIMDAPKDYYGHTVKHYFGPTNQQRYDQFLEGLKHTFGEAVIDQAFPLEQRRIENGSNSLFGILLTHLAETSLETIRPTLNKYLGNINLDISIPDQEADESLQQSTDAKRSSISNPFTPIKKAVRKAVKAAVETTVKDTQGILNERLKNIHLDLSIKEPQPPIDNPLSRAQIKNSLQRSYDLFKTQVSYLCHASSAARKIQQELRNLKDQMNEADLDAIVNEEKHHLNSFDDILESIQEIVTPSTETVHSIIEYQHEVVTTLHLDDSYVAEDELTLFLDRSAQKIASTLQAFAQAAHSANQLIEVKQSRDLSRFTETTEEVFRHQKEELLVHFRSACLRSTTLIATATKIVSHFKEQLPPHQEEREANPPLDQLATLVDHFCEQWSAFQ